MKNASLCVTCFKFGPPSRAPRRLSPTHADHHRPCAPRWSRDSARGQRSRCTAPACACSPLASATRRTHSQHRARRCHTTRHSATCVSWPTDDAPRTVAGDSTSIALLSKLARARASPSSSNVIDGHFVPSPLSCLLALLDERNEPTNTKALQPRTRTRHRVVCGWIRVPCILHFAFLHFRPLHFLC